MASTKILDSHIHFWPGTSVSPINHGWMTPGHFLAHRHGISEYERATETSSIRPTGFLYVETDRYLPSNSPQIELNEIQKIATNDEVKQSAIQRLSQWGREPLQELKFLRRIVDGSPHEGDGFEPEDSSKMVGCVIWAPFHLPTELFDLYLQIAEQISGPKLWQKVVGFRYLVQGIKNEAALKKLLRSQDWQSNILRLRHGRAGKGWAFDVGVDAHSGGVWQVEAAADMVDNIRKSEGDIQHGKVKLILNHLCKPDLSTPEAVSAGQWLTAIKRLAAQPGVYMKFSGGFNEFAPSTTPNDVEELSARLGHYSSNVFKLFGSSRVMFGSDWPVCNVGGPAGDNNWELWRRVVENVLRENQVDSPEDVWWRTGCEAYGVTL